MQSKYKSFNTAVVKFIERLEAEIFANREKLIIINAPPTRPARQTTAQKSKELAKNFVKKVVDKPVKKVAKKRSKKVKNIDENERRFWD
jgi:hypothetical protein